MATKADLRQQYVDDGWTVEPVANWTLVSNVAGKVKYDVNVVSPENRFGTGQVVVTDDGGPGETAEAAGFWEDRAETFGDTLNTFVRSLEGVNVGGGVTVFATRVIETSEVSEVGEVLAYLSDGARSYYVVKRRGDPATFTFDQTAAP